MGGSKSQAGAPPVRSARRWIFLVRSHQRHQHRFDFHPYTPSKTPLTCGSTELSKWRLGPRPGDEPACAGRQAGRRLAWIQKGLYFWPISNHHLPRRLSACLSDAAPTTVPQKARRAAPSRPSSSPVPTNLSGWATRRRGPLPAPAPAPARRCPRASRGSAAACATACAAAPATTRSPPRPSPPTSSPASRASG